MVFKMVHIDIDPFEKPDVAGDRTDETFPLLPIKSGDDQIDRSRIDETSFGGSQNVRVLELFVDELYQKLTNDIGQTPQAKFTDLFEIRDGELYYKELRKKSLTTNGSLRSVRELKKILGKTRLRILGFDIPKGNLPASKATILSKIEEELPSSSAISNTKDENLEELTNSISENIDNLEHQIYDINQQTQTDDLFEYPLQELLGLDKSMKTIRGTLMSEVAKKVELSEHIDREKNKLAETENDSSYTEEQREEIRERMRRLNDELKIRQESIDLLKGKLEKSNNCNKRNDRKSFR